MIRIMCAMFFPACGVWPQNRRTTNDNWLTSWKVTVGLGHMNSRILCLSGDSWLNTYTWMQSFGHNWLSVHLFTQKCVRESPWGRCHRHPSQRWIMQELWSPSWPCYHFPSPSSFRSCCKLTIRSRLSHVIMTAGIFTKPFPLNAKEKGFWSSCSLSVSLKTECWLQTGLTFTR